MKIFSNNTNNSNLYNSKLTQSKNTSKTPEVKKDKLSVNKGKELDEQAFAAALKSHIAKEINTPTDNTKIDKIKEQISLNQYNIDTHVIAKKILF